MQPDGTMAWRWQGGQVVDTSSASDADLDAARALVLAGTGSTTRRSLPPE